MTSIHDKWAKWPPAMQDSIREFLEWWCNHISIEPEEQLLGLLQKAYDAGHDDGYAEGHDDGRWYD